MRGVRGALRAAPASAHARPRGARRARVGRLRVARDGGGRCRARAAHRWSGARAATAAPPERRARAACREHRHRPGGRREGDSVLLAPVVRGRRNARPRARRRGDPRPAQHGEEERADGLGARAGRGGLRVHAGARERPAGHRARPGDRARHRHGGRAAGGSARGGRRCRSSRRRRRWRACPHRQRRTEAGAQAGRGRDERPRTSSAPRSGGALTREGEADRRRE